MNRFLVPLGIFVAILGFLFVGLELNPREVPSPLVDKPAPGFRLPLLHAPEQSFGPEDMRGRVWLLNVWASWCVPCREELPVLGELARAKVVPIVGFNYKDKPGAATALLRELGDPYLVSVVDADGRVGIDWGVYGVPETFVIDRQGMIRQKHIGAVTREVLDKKILPLVRDLQAP